MNCPHCGMAIPVRTSKSNGSAKYQEDVRKAEAAIEVLGRQPYAELKEACEMEAFRLLMAIDDPAKLYAIYRRNDKRTPTNYGMVATRELAVAA